MYTPILKEQLIDKPRIEWSKYLGGKGSRAEAPIKSKDVTLNANIYAYSNAAYLPVQNFAYKIPPDKCFTKDKIEEKIPSDTNHSTSWTKCTAKYRFLPHMLGELGGKEVENGEHLSLPCGFIPQRWNSAKAYVKTRFAEAVFLSDKMKEYPGGRAPRTLARRTKELREYYNVRSEA